MSRIESTFARLRADGRHALIPFIMSGDPHPRTTVAIMHAAVAAGADIIELGVPFSDPMADGPVIQRAGERAMKFGVSLRDVLGLVREFRTTQSKVPVVLMGYANPIEVFPDGGCDGFIAAARAAGVDGLIVVDYPPEECADFAANLRAAGLDLIFLLAPTSTPERIDEVVRLASGYLYYVSLTGVTGASNIDLADVLKHVQAIRAKTTLPVGVGFGIRDGATARSICGVADAAIIGSRLVQEIEKSPDDAPAQVGRFLSEVRLAMDAR